MFVRGARPNAGYAGHESLIERDPAWQSPVQAEGAHEAPVELNNCFRKWKFWMLSDTAAWGGMQGPAEGSVGKSLSTCCRQARFDVPAFAERFSREARAMAIVDHPRHISIYDFGQRGAGSTWSWSMSTD